MRLILIMKIMWILTKRGLTIGMILQNLWKLNLTSKRITQVLKKESDKRNLEVNLQLEYSILKEIISEVGRKKHLKNHFLTRKKSMMMNLWTFLRRENNRISQSLLLKRHHLSHASLLLKRKMWLKRLRSRYRLLQKIPCSLIALLTLWENLMKKQRLCSSKMSHATSTTKKCRDQTTRKKLIERKRYSLTINSRSKLKSRISKNSCLVGPAISLF